MKTINISGIVDVNMYNTILDPDVALESDDNTEEAWDQFDAEKYKALVCERAVVELKALLPKLPGYMQCNYVEGSAHIDSPKFYNYRGDELRFQVTCEADLSEKCIQDFLDSYFRDDRSAEFGSAYRIYEYIKENCTFDQFTKE